MGFLEGVFGFLRRFNKKKPLTDSSLNLTQQFLDKLMFTEHRFSWEYENTEGRAWVGEEIHFPALEVTEENYTIAFEAFKNLAIDELEDKYGDQHIRIAYCDLVHLDEYDVTTFEIGVIHKFLD